MSQSHPDYKVGQVAQELGRMWKELTEQEKKTYEEMATRDKGRYEVEMRDYKASGGGSGPPASKKGGGRGAAAAASTSAQSQSVDDEPEEDEEEDEGDDDD